MSDYQGKKFYVFSESVDMRKQMDGLIHIAKERFDLDPFEKSSFIFCNKYRDKIKILRWDTDGFVVTYKRMEKSKFHYPLGMKTEIDIISREDYLRLMRGLPIEKYITTKRYLTI